MDREICIFGVMDSGQTSSAVNRDSRYWSSELGMGQAILSRTLFPPPLVPEIPNSSCYSFHVHMARYRCSMLFFLELEFLGFLCLMALFLGYVCFAF